jgi:hypothetical protein
LGNHTFNENTDIVKTVPVLIYKSKQGLTKDSEKTISMAATTLVKETNRNVARNKILLTL